MKASLAPADRVAIRDAARGLGMCGLVLLTATAFIARGDIGMVTTAIAGVLGIAVAIARPGSPLRLRRLLQPLGQEELRLMQLVDAQRKRAWAVAVLPLLGGMELAIARGGNVQSTDFGANAVAALLSHLGVVTLAWTFQYAEILINNRAVEERR